MNIILKRRYSRIIVSAGRFSKDPTFRFVAVPFVDFGIAIVWDALRDQSQLVVVVVFAVDRDFLQTCLPAENGEERFEELWLIFANYLPLNR